MTITPRSLLQLAGLFGIQTAYYNGAGERVIASAPSLLYALHVMGAPVNGLEHADEALRQVRHDRVRRVVEPVTVAWDGQAPRVRLTLAERTFGAPLSAELTLESGEQRRVSWDAPTRRLRPPFENGGERFQERTLTLPRGMPHGYHRLTFDLSPDSPSTLLIRAPLRAWTPADWLRRKRWAAFLPLYALETERSWGAGDFTDLRELEEWATCRGASAVGALPFLPSFLDKPFDPSPYAPVTRLFWNEFYVDPQDSPLAEDGDSRPSRSTVRRLRDSREVDYRGLMKAKWRVLSAQADRAFDHRRWRRELREFAPTGSDVEVYAQFRAVVDHRRTGWQEWPARLRERDLQPSDVDQKSVNRYVYAQWLAGRQIAGLTDDHSTRAELYLDLPVGAHPDGYDVWRWREQFALGVSAGAPPDAFFALGQVWGFPPLNPEASRGSGHRYFRACLQHHMQATGMLRIDHILGFHRMFWIPEGESAREGVYVRYPTDELYAIVCLESQRNQTVVIGENLGTVPREVNPAMRAHNLQKMYVGYFEIAPDEARPLRTATRDVAASLNTHDLPPFRSFWEGRDIAQREALGFMSAGEAKREARSRRALTETAKAFLRDHRFLEQEDVDSVFRAFLRFLAESPSPFVVVNMEDLWGETDPQNVPGTVDEHANWRRKARVPFEKWNAVPGLTEILDEMTRLRTLR